VDEDLFPEAYRKSEYIKGSNDEVPEPFRIARISKISVRCGFSRSLAPEDVRLTVLKFYRFVLNQMLNDLF
jgi:DNA (cytosine-5)-methyltransferase 1